MSDHATGMTRHDQAEAIRKVIDRAASLGLHGCVLLAPVCDECGECHDFQLMSDLDAEVVAGLLGYWARRARHEPKFVLPRSGSTRHEEQP